MSGRPSRVQVAQADAAAPVILVGRSPEHLAREIPVPVALEKIDFLPVLRHDRHDVLVAVARHVRDADVDRPAEAEQDVALEFSVAQILHPADLPLVIPELGDREVDPSAVREPPGLDIGDAGHVVHEHLPGEVLVAVVLEDDHGPDLVVVGRNLAHAGDQQVVVARAPHVDRGGVDRSRDLVAEHNFLELPPDTCLSQSTLFAMPSQATMSISPSWSRSTAVTLHTHGCSVTGAPTSSRRR